MSNLSYTNAQNIRLLMSNCHLIHPLVRDIIRGSPDVQWESIKGLETAKRLLKEAVVMPIKYPK
jgi:SpoVK/Ycf46/Vps4 family AAA+-type ATPase